MERKKICLYCQKEFIAKRIDRKWCSDSCKQMNSRRILYPEIYGKVVPIYYELTEEEYKILLANAKVYKLSPLDYAKHMATLP